MGADLYMAASSWRPEPPRVTWLSREKILVERDVFVYGYQEAYRGPATAEVRRLLRGLDIRIPPRPPLTTQHNTDRTRKETHKR